MDIAVNTTSMQIYYCNNCRIHYLYTHTRIYAIVGDVVWHMQRSVYRTVSVKVAVALNNLKTCASAEVNIIITITKWVSV